MGIIEQRIKDSNAVKERLLSDEILLQSVSDTVDVIVKSINNGGKIVLCGNGGSASDALHFVREI